VNIFTEVCFVLFLCVCVCLRVVGASCVQDMKSSQSLGDVCFRDTVVMAIVFVGKGLLYLCGWN